MGYKTIVIFISITILFASCESYPKNKIDTSRVSYVVISRSGNVNFRGLTKEQKDKFIEDWNGAPAIGPCIFIARCKIDVVYNDNSKRSFVIAGSSIKEYGVNDYCFNIGDHNYFDKLWDAAPHPADSAK